MKRELTEEKEKKTSFSTDYKKQTNSKPYFNNQNRPNNTNSGYDNRRYGNKHYNNNNNKSYEQKFPQNNQFSPHETETRQNYERENQNFQRSYPPTLIIINSMHQAVDIMINNPTRPTLFTG